MAQSSSARSDSRHQRESARDRDDHDRGRDSRDRNDDHRGRDARDREDDHSSRDHGRRDGSDDRHDGRDRGDHSDRRNDGDRDGRQSASDIVLTERRDGIDLEIDADQHGRRLDIDIELGSLDIDLDIDTRLLQPDTTPMTAVVGGEGNAVGEHTLVDADIFSRLLDLGSVSVAFGRASFDAAAVSGDGLLFAAADTFAAVAGADFVLIFTDESLMGVLEEGAVSAAESSTTRYVAIDFEDFDLLGGPLVIDYHDIERSHGRDCSCECGAGLNVQLDGNVAQLNVDALANAETTLVDVSSSILTVEDQLSSVTAVVVTAAA